MAPRPSSPFTTDLVQLTREVLFANAL